MKKDKTIQDLLKDISKFLDTIYDSIDEIDEVLNEIDGKVEENEASIKDIDYFIYQLKFNNLYSEELEKFIHEYIKYKN